VFEFVHYRGTGRSCAIELHRLALRAMPSDHNGLLPAPPIPKAGEVLTLDDVRAADFSSVTPLAVLGWPIKHSVSPQMHNAALAELAKTDPKFASWRYYRIEVPPERLKEALDLLAAKGFIGLNLTVPHKVMALEWVNVNDEMGYASGAVNTLFRKNGFWLGYNTDCVGFASAVNKTLSEPIVGRDLIVLGAGGASRAICAISIVLGCRSLYIGNRSKDRLDDLLTQLAKVNQTRNERHIPISGFDISQPLAANLPKNALIINATKLGLNTDDPSPIDLSVFGKDALVFDTTYGKHRSALLKQADLLGIRASGGIPMLVEQGHMSLFKYWLGNVPGQDNSRCLLAMENAAYKALVTPNPH
jgi:shikimate dehydrogenase